MSSTIKQIPCIMGYMKTNTGYKLIVKPKVFRFLGLIYNSAQSIYPYILIPYSLSKKIEIHDPESIAILEHEIIHFNRARSYGVLKWYLQYIFNPSFRLDEEVIAYKKQSEVLQIHKLPFDLEKYSTILSSWIYLKMVSKEKARVLLTFR